MFGSIVGRLLLYALLEDPKSLFESGLNFFELLIVISGLVLAWGAIGEYLEEHGKIDRLPRLLRWSKLVFVLMVVISLVGEFVGDGGVYVCSSKLQILEGATIKALDEKATAATHKAEGAVASSDAAVAEASGASKVSQKAYNTSDDAGRVARSARQEADSFEKDIVTAKKQAADAESHLAEALRQAADATAELNRIKKPRSLTNTADLIKSLQSFKGTEFSFGSVFGDEESFTFLKEIDRALAEAGWKRIKQGSIRIGVPAIIITGKDDLVELGTNTGVRVEVESTEAFETLQSLSEDKLPSHIRLAEVLNNIFFAHVAPSEAFTPRVNVTAGSSKVIRVKVGKKP